MRHTKAWRRGFGALTFLLPSSRACLFGCNKDFAFPTERKVFPLLRTRRPSTDRKYHCLEALNQMVPSRSPRKKRGKFLWICWFQFSVFLSFFHFLAAALKWNLILLPCVLSCCSIGEVFFHFASRQFKLLPSKTCLSLRFFLNFCWYKLATIFPFLRLRLNIPRNICDYHSSPQVVT